MKVGFSFCFAFLDGNLDCFFWAIKKDQNIFTFLIYLLNIYSWNSYPKSACFCSYIKTRLLGTSHLKISWSIFIQKQHWLLSIFIFSWRVKTDSWTLIWTPGSTHQTRWIRKENYALKNLPFLETVQVHIMWWIKSNLADFICQFNLHQIQAWSTKGNINFF